MRELNIFGIYVTPMLAYLIIAALLYWLIRYLTRNFHMEKYFWHPKLVQFCLFIVVLALVIFVALV
jgi:protein AaeX